MITAMFLLIAANLIFSVVRYVVAGYYIQEYIVSVHPFYVATAIIFPAIWWAYSTREDRWNFWDRKRQTLWLVVINDAFVIGQIIWTFLFDTVVLIVSRQSTGRNMDAGMLANLCRIILIGSSAGFVILVFRGLNKLLEVEEITERIDAFRWQHIVDTRKNKENLYDLQIIKDMKTGRDVPIKERDRFVHQFFLGGSGTGKTSSTIIPAVICDLNKKLENKQHRQAELVKMLQGGKAYIKRTKQKNAEMPESLTEYDIFAEKPDNEDRIAALRKKYPDCGITVMAPNNAMNVDIIKLAKARGERVNVIDPAYQYDEPHVRMLGINPFYVPLGLGVEERQIEISNKASTFAEVLMAVSEINGTSDQYFRDINTSVTTNVAIMCMLHANLNGRQTNIAEIQACINDFGKLKIIVENIQNKLNMKVVVHEVKKPGKERGRMVSRDNMGEIALDGGDKEDERIEYDDILFKPIENEDQIPEPYRTEGWTIEEYTELMQEEGRSYYEPIHFVMQELLGAGNEKMFDQARGLRNLINKLLLDPRIKKLLSATEDNFIDWDRALLHNEITVINTALEFGPQGSTALGLFIMLNMKIAIMRRPAGTRSNHFLYIDEAAQYMHPMYEDMFALYRQYGVGCTLAMQSLSQMEKSPLTKYLRGVIMSAGTHIVFGRVNADEMTYYEAMAGITKKETKQTSVISNSEFDESYRINSGSRTSIEDVNVLDGYKIRMRDFQEVTVYMVDDGRVKAGFIGKVSFPKDIDFADKHIRPVRWERYLTKETSRVPDDLPAKGDSATRIRGGNEINPALAHREDRMQRNREAAIKRLETYDTGYSNIDRRESETVSNLSDYIREAAPQKEAVDDEVVRQRRGRADMLLASIHDMDRFDRAAQAEKVETAGSAETETISERKRERSAPVGQNGAMEDPYDDEDIESQLEALDNERREE